MKENKETNQSENQKNDGISRRSFIGKMSLLGAGLAAGALSLGASQNQTSAQTGKRNNTKSASNASIGRRRLRQAGGLGGRAWAFRTCIGSTRPRYRTGRK